MKKLLKILLIVELVAISFTMTSPLALLYDSEQAIFSGNAASLILTIRDPGLEMAVKESVSWNLGNNLVPGDAGVETLQVTNGGSIAGTICYEVTQEPPSFLHVTFDEGLCNTLIQAGETRDFTVSWEIPADANLGTGGQEINFGLSVELEQD